VNILINACHLLGESLLQVDQECGAMLEELYRFESDVSSEPPLWIKLRLNLIALQIMHSAVSLYEEHGDKGFVFVTLTETAIGVYWDKRKELFKSENSTNSTGMQLLSVEEGMAILTKLENEVESGSYSEVIAWINQHAIFGV